MIKPRPRSREIGFSFTRTTWTRTSTKGDQTLPRSKKPRKKYRKKDPLNAVYRALLMAGLSETEAEAIARANEPEPKTYRQIERR